MDTLTLRIAQAAVTLTIVVLFYLITYRTTRSPYSGWWCLSLIAFVAGTLLFLGNHTQLQVVTTPVGSMLAVAGSCCTWAAARSLRERKFDLWPVLVLPGVVLVAAALDGPANDVWAGGPVFLVCMALGFAACSREMALLLGTLQRGSAAPEHRRTVGTLSLMAGVVGAYYLLRSVVIVAVGADHPVFEVGFGTQATTLLTTVLLVVVTFSMSMLSQAQQMHELRTQATQDALTGVLNRAGFFRVAEEHFASLGAGPGRGVVMVADLDDFKSLNDTHGHAAGDAALVQFADACHDVTGPGDGIGRLGGDEFVLLLAEGERAEEIAAEISLRMRRGSGDHHRATVSFGVAVIDPWVSVKDTIIRADIALYRAKAAGRDRIVRYDERAA